jgi:hypothetical protein
MNYISSVDNDRPAGATPAFRTTAALLSGVAVLLFFLVGSDAGLGDASAWVAAVVAAGVALMLADVLIALIMVALPPVLILAVLVRFLTA